MTHQPAQPAVTILEYLQQEYPGAKKTTLRDMIAGKRVRLNGQPVKSLKQTVGASDQVEVGLTGKARVLAEGLRIVYHDGDVIVVEKPGGLLTSTHSAETRPTVLGILERHFMATNQKARVHLIHRLDQGASGLLVFARRGDAAAKLKVQFAAHTIERVYDVLAHGRFSPAQGRLQHLLYEDQNGIVHVGKDPRTREAVLDYQAVGEHNGISRVYCTLHTGRKHQIRVQLQAVGHPVCGDGVYGTPAARQAAEPPHRLALHAIKLAFEHPRTGERVAFTSTPPASWDHIVPLHRPDTPKPPRGTP